MLIEYFKVPEDAEQKYRVMQNSISREHHQNLLDYLEIDAWYHYKNITEETSKYNYVVVTIFPSKDAFENRNALLHFEEFLVDRSWFEARPIIQEGMDQAVEGTYAQIDRLDMLEDIGKLEAELSKGYKSDFNRLVEEGLWDGYGLFMASDNRFKADNPYLLVHFSEEEDNLRSLFQTEAQPTVSFKSRGSDRWKLMYSVNR